MSILLKPILRKILYLFHLHLFYFDNKLLINQTYFILINLILFETPLNTYTHNLTHTNIHTHTNTHTHSHTHTHKTKYIKFKWACL